MQVGPTLNNLFGKAFVKNLKRSTERRNNIEAQCRQVDLQYEIFEAVDGKLHVNADFTIMHGPYFLQYPSSAGYIGCQMTFHNIISHAIKNKYEKIMILDDDCQFHHTLNADKSILSDLEHDVPKDWDVIILGDMYGEEIANQKVSYHKCQIHGEAAGSHGLAINSSVYEDLLSVLSGTSFLGDGVIGRMIDIKKNVYKIMPSICTQDRKIFSDINEMHHTY